MTLLLKSVNEEENKMITLDQVKKEMRHGFQQEQ